MADASRAGSLGAEIPSRSWPTTRARATPCSGTQPHGSFGENPKLYKGRAQENVSPTRAALACWTFGASTGTPWAAARGQRGPGREGAQRVLCVSVGGDRASRLAEIAA